VRHQPDMASMMSLTTSDCTISAVIDSDGQTSQYMPSKLAEKWPRMSLGLSVYVDFQKTDLSDK